MEAEWHDHVISAGEAGTRPVLAALSIALWAAPRMAISHRVRLRAAKFVLGLFQTQSEVVGAVLAPLRESKKKSKRDIHLGVVALMTALPMVTIMYPLRGRRAAQYPLALLGAAGALGWLMPFLTLIPHSPVTGVMGLVACAIWLATTRMAIASLDTAFTIRVTLRVGGPALRALLDDDVVGRSTSSGSNGL